MSKSAKIDISHNAATRVMCDKLQKVADGMVVMGLHIHLIEQVIAKLNAQSIELERLRSERSYVVGLNDGWTSALESMAEE